MMTRFILLLIGVPLSFAFSLHCLKSDTVSSVRWTQNRLKAKSSSCNSDESLIRRDDARRKFLIFTALCFPFGSFPAVAIERAVGEAEKTCREKGNCLENFDIDGAVGWNWGGKDRCDATDPRCGPDGKMMESPPSGAAVPWTVDKNDNAVQITNVIQLDFGIGKNEQGSIRIGLYGNSCPESVSQLLDFMENGIVTTSKLMLEDGFGVSASPVSFRMGGSLTTVCPQSRLEFGVPSQATSYAKSRGLNRIPKNFVPQPRPSGPRVDAISKEQSVRPHDVAGLLSIPKNGIGFGGTGLESDDEAFASAFEITAASVPAMDRESRKVIGQVMDQESMTFLARLASLATKKGLKGILPGQNAGPPLVKTSITFVSTIQPSS